MTISHSPVDVDPEETDPIAVPQINEFKRKSVSGAISYTIRSIFLNLFGVVTGLVLGYYLSAEDFGVYGIVAQVIGILQFFSSIGLGPTLIQKKTEPTIREYRTVFTVQQLLSWFIVFVAVGLIAAGLFPAGIGRAGQLVFLALAISFPLDSLRIISAIMLERKLDFQKLVIPSVFEQVVYNITLIVSVIIFQQGVMSYAYAIILRGIVGTTVMFIIQRWPIGLAWDKAIIRSFLSSALKFQGSDLLAKVKDQLFYIFLARSLPLHQFGYISWAKGWSQMPYNLTVQNVVAITFPAYSRLQHDKKLLKKAIEKTLYFISLTIFPVLACMSLYIFPFTTIIVKYQKWQPALLTFVLFTLSIGWAAVSTPLTNTLSAIGQVNKTFQLMVMWTILTWVVTPLCMHLWGFNGVAIAAFFISFTSLMPIYFLRQYVHIDVFGQVKDPLIATICMSLLTWLGLSLVTSIPLLFIAGVCSIGIYGIVILLIGKQKLLSEVKSLLKAKNHQ
jgi:O-antigen/teichoic acid export membrane protein